MRGRYGGNAWADRSTSRSSATTRRSWPSSLVDSLDETLAKVTAAGGKLVFGPNEIPYVGTHAYCEDPQGNLFGVIEEPKG